MPFCEYRDMLRKEFIIIATVIRIFAYLYAVENGNTVARFLFFFIFTSQLRCYYYWYYSCHLPAIVHIHIEDTNSKVLFHAGTAQLRPSANCFRARSYSKNDRFYLRCAHTSATYTTHLNISIILTSISNLQTLFFSILYLGGEIVYMKSEEPNFT